MGNSRGIVVLLTFFSILAFFTGTATAINDTTELVSIHNNGSEANGYCYEPSISADGRYVAFSSYANNLVDDDTNYYSDIFVRDRLLNITERISVPSAGEEGDGDSYEPFISSDGRYVTFTSYASNLVENDIGEFADIFVRDRLLNITQRLSVSSTGEEGNDESYGSSISSDGRYVAFYSFASNFVEHDTNGFSDIFLFDRISNTIKRINTHSDGDEANSDSYEPIISADGNFIAFTSYANNLVQNDNNNESDVFVFDRNQNSIKRVSISSGGDADGPSYEPSISSDGRYIAFSSWANNLVEHDTTGEDVFIYDQILGITERVSVSSTGEESDEDSYNPSISGDGHYVAFSSYANNLVQGYDNYYRNIFVYYNNNNLSSIYAVLYPKTVKSGDQITVKAYSPNSISVNVRILGNTFKMGKRLDGLWYLDYVVSSVTDGVYDVLVIATDSADNQEQINLNFTVDNTPPMISATVTPTLVKSGDRISIDALTSKDTINVTALILGERFDLYPENNGWKLYYWIPQLSDGNYPILLTATDKAGNQNTTALYFTADNTPPVFSGSVTPDTVKTYDNLTITATSDSDTTSVSALILNQTYHLTKLADGTWTLQYTVPYISDGSYHINS